jgi:hypothetical protein
MDVILPGGPPVTLVVSNLADPVTITMPPAVTPVVVTMRPSDPVEDFGD